MALIRELNESFDYASHHGGATPSRAGRPQSQQRGNAFLTECDGIVQPNLPRLPHSTVGAEPEHALRARREAELNAQDQPQLRNPDPSAHKDGLERVLHTYAYVETAA